MAGNTRLRLAKDVGQVRHSQLGLGDQRKDPETRFFARGLEGGIERVEVEPAAGAHGAPCRSIWALSPLYKDIFIRLIQFRQALLPRPFGESDPYEKVCRICRPTSPPWRGKKARGD